jgi:uncharacterized membrane protein
MSPVTVLRAVHIASGTVALSTFLIPMVLPKGGAGHRRVGWVFVGAMMALCASAGPLSIYRLATETSRGQRIAAGFLLYITILSFAAVWGGLRVLRFKGTGPHTHPLDLGVAGLLAVTGLITLALGAFFSAPVLAIFGALGLVNGVGDVRQWLDPDKARMHWWFRHMGGMIGASIAALTAFSVLNAPRLGLGVFSVFVWILPSLILVPVSMVWNRHYQRRFGMVRAKREVQPALAPRAA